MNTNVNLFAPIGVMALLGTGLLYPHSRVLTLVDERGSKHTPSDAAQRAFDAAQTSVTPLTAPLRPGQSYTTEIVFDLPANAKPTTLLINEGDWITHLVIGHENSLLHKKTAFQINLPPAPLARFDPNSQAWETTLSRSRCELHQPGVHSRLIQSASIEGPPPQTNRDEARAGEGISPERRRI